MDFPRAWEIARSIPVAEHDKRCSYFRTDGGLLCDCDVLTKHPEYDDIERAPEPTEPDEPDEQTSAVAVAEPIHDEGRFAEEQDAVAAEVAHAGDLEDWDDEDEPGGEVEVLGSNPVVQPEGRDEGNDPPINPLDIPDEYDLPMHGSVLCCPKCGHNTVRVEWHAHGMLGAPCGVRFGWPRVQNLGEHLCRTCVRCQYGWPEQVFSGA